MKLDSAWFYFKFGNKNLWRRKSRTLLLGISFLLLSLLMVLLLGYSKGMSRQVVGKAIETFLGDYAVYSTNSVLDALQYKKLQSFDVNDVLSRVHLDKGVKVRRQYRNFAFLYTEDLQSISLVMGVDKKDKDKFIIKEGKNLSFKAPGANEILLSSTTANKLNVKIGDRIAVEVVTVNGMRNFNYFTVVGTYKIPGTMETVIGYMAYMSYDDMLLLMNEKPNYVTELLFYQPNSQKVHKLGDSLKSIKGRYVVKSYSEYGSMLVQIVSSSVMMVWILGIVAMLVIGVFFFDTMISTIEERKREFGTMICLGLSKAQVSLLVLAEFAVFTFYFVLPGIISGKIIVDIIGKVGIPIPEVVSSFMGGMDRLRPYINIGSLVALFGVIFLLIEFANLISIIKINKLKPVEVLRNE